MGVAGAVPRSFITRVNRVTGPVWDGGHTAAGVAARQRPSTGLVRVPIEPAGHGRCRIFTIKPDNDARLHQPDQFVAALAEESE